LWRSSLRSPLSSCHFLPLTSKYYPQHPVLKYPKFSS